MSSEDFAADLKARVEELLDEHHPATSDPRDFLGAQFDAGLTSEVSVPRDQQLTRTQMV